MKTKKIQFKLTTGQWHNLAINASTDPRCVANYEGSMVYGKDYSASGFTIILVNVLNKDFLLL